MIKQAICAPGLGAFFYDDQRAIRAGAQMDGFRYLGEPRTPGFHNIRMPAESLGIGLVLDDGYVAWGDMMSVQYAAAGGREAVFSIRRAQSVLDEFLIDRLISEPATSFRQAVAAVLAPLPNGTPVSAAMRYGISQALLRAVAQKSRMPMAAVLAKEYGVELMARPVPIYAQSGDERYLNVEKMVLKRVEILPHGLINAPSKLGTDGVQFLDYVRWVSECARRLGGADYKPRLHFDVYGTIGLLFDGDLEKMADYICRVAEAAEPFEVNLESPADFGSTAAQVDGFAKLRRKLRSKGCGVRIVADEWCDTLADVLAFAQAEAADVVQIKLPDMGSLADSFEAALLCKSSGIGAYVGGSCVETDLSARVSVHLAVAAQAEMQLAKPGMGVDEALTIVGNEQSRLLAELALLGQQARR